MPRYEDRLRAVMQPVQHVLTADEVERLLGGREGPFDLASISPRTST